MNYFRVDESGYTGFDLLNEEQRFQGASAIAISDDEAARLIAEHFPRLQAPELKYKSLSRREGNHGRLLGLMKDVLAEYRCVTYVGDKRFLLTLMFLDYAVEPYYFERGIDFYADGQNYAMGSMLHRAGPPLLGRPQFDNLMAVFQRAMKEKSPQSLKDLVAAARATKWRELPEVMGPLAQYASPECLEAIATKGGDTDMALVVMQALISRMEVMSDEPYSVEHDRSENLARYGELLQRIIDIKDEVEFKQSEIASLKFPLKLKNVMQVDSKASPAVQIADVMIGAAIDAANNLTGFRKGGLDPEKLMPLYRDDQFIHMLPSLDFSDQRNFRTGSQASQMIDFLATKLAGPEKA